MLDKMFELFTKTMLGEHLTDEEQLYAHRYNAHYVLVRYVYMEKINASNPGSQLMDFHMTPGVGFLDTPVFDLVESLLKINEMVKSGVVQRLDFGDGSRVESKRDLLED
jgi:hypothetical protein